MKASEYIWERIGTIAIAVLTGGIYGLIVSPIIIYFFPKIAVIDVLKIFSLVFMVVGLFSSNFLINSVLTLIYAIVGYFAGLLASGGGTLPEDFKNIKQGSALFISLGVISAIFTILIYR
jgi:hypothetical protein